MQRQVNSLYELRKLIHGVVKPAALSWLSGIRLSPDVEVENWKMKMELMSGFELKRLKASAADGHPVRRIPELAAFLEMALAVGVE